MNLVHAFIGLGANLGKPEEQIRAAVAELELLPGTWVVAVSSLYRSAPVGFAEQPDFINAVAHIETMMTPRALLDALLAIERRHGRVREFANAPRTLDLDILLYGDREIREPGLTVPHPRLHERAFVVIPLAEIAPETIVPGHGRAGDLVATVDPGAVEKLKPTER